MDVALQMFFFTWSNVKINFTNQEHKQRLFIIIKTFSTTRQVKLVRKKEFATAILNLNNEIFVVYIALALEVYLFYKAHLVFLNGNKTLIFVFLKYTNFASIFSKN